MRGPAAAAIANGGHATKKGSRQAALSTFERDVQAARRTSAA
ncbi:hypothetical protein BURMUCGD2M_0327 [Burkholderia multivorans CGD2M]|uniref:Uncharacterized protein n=1 Tax=Burkholderia multivorans CGD2 TaxID=513052 RepID=B9BV85_9BURK|nr:hypothetical protein BURMUCGD2_0331 [Burkholderia multivorans CGD2]EEE10885.1 hypothetical protein BURMUCGD2M_0327 [Burkholderia multivorans CGD2M]